MLTFVRKIAPVALAASLAATSLTPVLAAHPRVGNQFNLLVYTKMGPGAETQMIQNLATQWASSHGGTAKVIYDTGDYSDFIHLVHSPKAPDVYFGQPDDDTGKIQASGLLEPVPAGIFNPDDYLKAAQEAVTFGGKAYAVPLVMDNVALVYNKKLVPTPPKTWDQLVSIASKFPNTRGKNYGFLFDITNFYFAYPFLSGSGGYVFKYGANGYDATDIGLGNAGSVQMLTQFKSLIDKKLVPNDINYDTAKSLFQKGQLGMFVDGDWDVGSNRAALGKNFGATTIPTMPGGGQSRVFAGVYDAIVNQYSPNKSIVYQFLKYMAPALQIPDLQTAGRIPALKSATTDPSIAKDPVLSAYAKSSASGDLLPNIPAMSAVWTPASNAIKLVITGKSTPATAAANLLSQVKEGISQLGQ